MTEVRHKDRPNEESEYGFLKTHVFESDNFHIEGEYSLLEPTLPIKKFVSTQEVAEKIKQFLDSQKINKAI